MGNVAFGKAFETAFAYCEDGVFKSPVSLIVSRTYERVMAGYDLARSFEETLAEIDPETQKIHPEKYRDVIRAARTGLGLQKDDAKTPPELMALRPSPPRPPQ